MAAVIEMGEVDEIHSKEETIKDNSNVNGVCDFEENETPAPVSKTVENNVSEDDGSESPTYIETIEEEEEEEEGKMLVDEVDSEDVSDSEDSDKSADDDDDDDQDEEEDEEEVEDDEDEKTESENGDKTETYTVISEDNNEDGSDIEISDQEENGLRNGNNSSTDEGPKSVESGELCLRDNADGEDDANSSKDMDVVVIDDKDPIENGSNFKGTKSKTSDNIQIINLDSPVKKNKFGGTTVRRSSRNVFKEKVSYSIDEEEEKPQQQQQPSHTVVSDESDIEEILPEDPLAETDPLAKHDRKESSANSTIVVKDTKRLVEIASKSTTGSNSKKEPTLVIIDTNSILSGRGPVPIAQKPATTTPSLASSFSMLPMALPAQGVYPPNMRATITPIPMAQSQAKPAPAPPPQAAPPASPVPVLPTLTDDMFVVEAPSFIVPYVYEKPPLKDFKEFVNTVRKEVLAQEKRDEKDDEKDDASDKGEGDNEKENDDKIDLDMALLGELGKKSSTSYFDSPLGKFFVGIGFSLVQEAVQTDLLRQQKRKKEREGGQNADTKKTINTLLKNLEFSKENNEPFRMQIKKCEFCSYKTESALAMAFHLETPHMKNYVYRCNFCPYEVRSPHDILFHMEVQHGVRGRLERAPAFHQCPNCPFEDNQKGKLSRHLVACTRKFKPERNLEPPLDWEPPAKIPRAPRMKSQNLNAATAVYQAMAKNTQYQMLAKMQSGMPALQRGRGRPMGASTLKSSMKNAGMLYKQGTMSGGSVLVPTNYQLSGNQLYQVVGGQEMGGRLASSSSGGGGVVPFLPHSATNPIAIQQNKMKSVQQPSISITPLPRGSSTPSVPQMKPGDSNSKNSFVICEICDGYIKDLEQLRNHMQWIHKVKIHPKMIYNRPPLNCQKCQFRFFTDQGLERHLLGSHGLVTSSMQEAANKSKDAGRCPVCGRVYQWKLLNHVARDHNMTLKPAHLSYKCTVCTATFGMYKQFESHVYSAHSVVAKRSMDKKPSAPTANKADSILKPLKINDEITIIPQPAKSSNGAGNLRNDSPSTSTEAVRINTSTPSTSKSGSESLKTV